MEAEKSQAVRENKETEIKSQAISQDNERLREIVKKLENRHMINEHFNGRWKLTYTDSKGKHVEELKIYNENYTIIDDNEEFLKFKLKLIDYDEIRQRLSFIKVLQDQRDNNITHAYCNLEIVGNDRWEGTENDNIKVTYERQKLAIKKSDEPEDLPF